MISAWRSFLRDEGIALPVAMGVMLSVALLGGGLATTAMNSSKNSNKNRGSKLALSAAEAGLRVATYRLNALKPPGATCLRSNAVPAQQVVATVGGECPVAGPEQLGNGATYAFTASAAGAACGNLPGASAASPLARCVTSVGTVRGVQRRVQTRVVPRSAYPFIDTGLIGIDSVSLKNAAAMYGTDVGTNGTATLGPGTISSDGALQLGAGPPAATSTGSTAGFAGGVQSRPSYQVPELDFSRTRPSQGGANNNSSLSGNPSFNSGTRALRLSNGAQLTLQPGIYNFCSVELVNSNQLIIPATGVVKIYVDSPADPNSGCGANTGRFEAHNSSQINETAGNPANLDVYVLGTGAETAGRPDVLLDNSIRFRGTIVAPNSTVYLENSVVLQAAILAKHVYAENSISFTLPAALKNRPAGSGGTYKRAAWFECRPRPAVATDPESGC